MGKLKNCKICKKLLEVFKVGDNIRTKSCPCKTERIPATVGVAKLRKNGRLAGLLALIALREELKKTN